MKEITVQVMLKIYFLNFFTKCQIYYCLIVGVIYLPSFQTILLDILNENFHILDNKSNGTYIHGDFHIDLYYNEKDIFEKSNQTFIWKSV